MLAGSFFVASQKTLKSLSIFLLREQQSGVIELPIFRGIRQCKCMVISRDFSKMCALCGLVSFTDPGNPLWFERIRVANLDDHEAWKVWMLTAFPKSWNRQKMGKKTPRRVYQNLFSIYGFN